MTRDKPERDPTSPLPHGDMSKLKSVGNKGDSFEEGQPSQTQKGEQEVS